MAVRRRVGRTGQHVTHRPARSRTTSGPVRSDREHAPILKAAAVRFSRIAERLAMRTSADCTVALAEELGTFELWRAAE
jgi:hypothetical protein